MSMQDPISDMLTRMRNALMVKKKSVSMPLSKMKISIANVLKDSGYINNYDMKGEKQDATITIELKYFEGKPVIEHIERISRPGLRIYKNKSELPKVRNGLGIAIVSTSKGVMTDMQARQMGLGGEIICHVS